MFQCVNVNMFVCTHVCGNSFLILSQSVDPLQSDLPGGYIKKKLDCVVTGLGFVVETVVGKGELYLCELCNMRSNLNNMVDHIIGIKHRLAYLVPRLVFHATPCKSF